MSHELILCIQITRGREDFNGDTEAKSTHRGRFSNLTHSEVDFFQPNNSGFEPFSWKLIEMPIPPIKYEHILLMAFLIAAK